MKQKEIINRVIEIVCDDLEIEQPRLVYGFEKMTVGNIARVKLNENKEVVEIQVTDDFSNLLDVIFAIIHELRHIWQLQQDCYFKDYKQLEELELEQYLLQSEELDANAYATVLMNELFKVKPQFHGYSDFVKSKIFTRVDEILNGRKTAEKNC